MSAATVRIYQSSYLLAFVLLLAACMPSTIKDHQAFSEQHLSNNPRIEHILIEQDTHLVHAAIVAGSTELARKSAVVFIHGTPGDWQNAGRYLLSEELSQFATVVSLDRPGWGRSISTIAEDQAAFSKQADGIALVLKRLRDETGVSQIILAGHSLGASIAPQVAISYPNLVDGLLLMAGSLNPELGGPRWYNRLAALPGAYYILPKVLVNSNREIMRLRKNLLEMRAGWQQLSLPIVVIQGMKDKLVYPENIDFAEAQLLEQGNLTAIRLEQAGHLVNLEQQTLVINTLQNMLDQSGRASGSSIGAAGQM